MKTINLFLTLLLCPLTLCFAEIPMENPETGAVIVFPKDDSVNQTVFEGGIAYSSGGGSRRISRYCGNEVTYFPTYKWTINWMHLGLSDEDIFRNFMHELKDTKFKEYYIYSYGKVGDFKYSEKLVAKNSDDRIQLAIIVKDGIVYQIETGEKISKHWGECSAIIGVTGDHDRFLYSFRVKND